VTVPLSWSSPAQTHRSGPVRTRSFSWVGRVGSEEEIRRLNEDLEDLVRERTQDLESFSYSVSHDLIAPLRAINGFGQILLEDYGGNLSEDGRDLVERITRNTIRMHRLINDLLNFSRLGRAKMNRVSIDMGTLFREAYAALSEEVGDRDIDYRIGQLPDVRADRSMLAQVVHNLLSNAVKFSRQRDRATIEVDGVIVDTEVMYSVGDNGVGFDASYADKIFEVFQRLHASDGFEGTGVGLAIVKRIVERHGGRAWAEAATGEGATIRFALPLNPDP